MISSVETLSGKRAPTTGILWNRPGRGLSTIIALLATPFLPHHLGIDLFGIALWAVVAVAMLLVAGLTLLDATDIMRLRQIVTKFVPRLVPAAACRA